ncbi:MAG: hypothetical protein IPJ30_11970 [Acidobacteria bacterium]|nr:hypothetical protein [Acidobacteriota bacterium]
MKSTVVLFLMILVICISTNAQDFNNYTKEYVLVSQTEARTEASRTHRMILCDYQPSGLYVRRGETITVVVNELDDEYKLSTMIGFKPMWEPQPDPGKRTGKRREHRDGEPGRHTFIHLREKGRL